MQGIDEVAIGNLKPGAVLAEAVLDGEGRVLLAPGAVLTSMLIQRLDKWQVSSVRVVATAGSTTAAAGTTAAAPATVGAAAAAAGASPGTNATGEPDPLVIWDGLFAATSDSPETRCIHQALVFWYEKHTPVVLE